ncbi:MAG: AAA family ATPase [Deltaproteobacteria bacterium]|nr:AAA family ATPase [Deltaproteobacteria bacterium]
MNDAAALATMLRTSRVVVCVGPGGVGKTSTAASIALSAARSGRRSLVLTIDPAKRLANALGLPEIGHVESDVSQSAFRAASLPVPAGRMTAMMLDIKTAWDEVVARHHPDPSGRQRLLQNRLYVALSTALAGSQEYMAMEKLFELSTRREDPLDLIVLDTPPAEHAIDFLEAPSRILDALDNEATRWLVEPFQASGRISKKVFDAGSSFFIRTIARFTGTELLQDLAEMLSEFQGMFDGFRARAQAVRMLLEASDTAFAIIGGPRKDALDAVAAFHERLRQRGARVGMVVFNRVETEVLGPCAGLDEEALAGYVGAAGGTPDLMRRIVRLAEATDARYREEQRRIDALLPRLGDTQVVRIPELGQDIHDLRGLDILARTMFSAEAPVF